MILPAWLLPVLLAAVQFTTWPLLPLLRGGPVGAGELAGGLAVSAALATALTFRRRYPVPVAAAVVVLTAAGPLTLPENAMTVIAAADLIALYAVAVHTTSRLTLVVTVAMSAVQIPVQMAAAGLTPVEAAFTPVFYVLIAAAGRIRSRWHADRAAAAARFAAAEARRARAAEDERGRLARELHDVTAHHLTAIVVGTSAAERLAGTRPELTAEALAAAARTGRETLGALRRLVAIMHPGGDDRLDLAGLAASLRELGRPITLHADPVPPAIDAAASAIAREALTNSLRYAPDAPVTVTLRSTGGTAELTVDDHPRAGTGPAASGLGGGSGIRGMRERAAALGGTLTAGPRPDGGWRVRAVLPESPGRVLPQARRPLSERVVDLTFVLLATGLPVAGLLAPAGDGAGVTAVAAGLAVALAQGVTMLWRRSRPLTAALALAVAGWGAPVLIWAGVLPPGAGWLVPLGFPAVLIAAYAAGRWVRTRMARIWAWAVVLVLFAGFTLAAAVVTAQQPIGPEEAGGDPPPAMAVLVGMVFVVGTIAALPVAGCWVTGLLVRRRREHRLRLEDGAVAWSAHHALLTAGAERVRVAGGLRAAVLSDTEAMVAAAEGGDLAGVLRHARAALAAMRSLLSELRETPDAGRDPEPVAGDRVAQPTLAAVPALVARWQAHGRELTAEVDAGEFPADVEVSAYRVVELMLAADTGPARLRVETEPLRITVRPAPPDPDGTVAAGLRARAAAAGGRVRVAADGLEVLLSESESEGVAASPSV